MPVLLYNWRNFTALGEIAAGEVPPGVVAERGATLRRVGPSYLYERDADLQAEAIFETEVVAPRELRELYSLEVVFGEGQKPKTWNTAVSLQVSTDNGVTYLSWTGAAWEAQAVNGEYTSLENFNEYLDQLTWVHPGQIKFRVRLVLLNDAAPALKYLKLGVEFNQDYDTFTDLFGTLKQLGQALEINITRRTKLLQAANTFVIDSEYAVSSVIKVFNLTTDPDRNTDLFNDYAADTKTVTLTGQQAADSVLLYVFRAQVPTLVARADEIIEVTDLPKNVFYLDVVEDEFNRASGLEVATRQGVTERTARTRVIAPVRNVPVRLQHWGTRQRDCLQWVRAISKRLADGLALLGSGHSVQAIEIVPARVISHAAQSFFVGVWEGEIRLAFLDNMDYTQVELVSEIALKTGNTTDVWRTDDKVIQEGT